MDEQATPAMATKPFWQSKTFWGLAVMVVSPLAAKYGLSVTDEDVGGLINVVAEAVGGVMIIIGRITATKKVTLL